MVHYCYLSACHSDTYTCNVIYSREVWQIAKPYSVTLSIYLSLPRETCSSWSMKVSFALSNHASPASSPVVHIGTRLILHKLIESKLEWTFYLVRWKKLHLLTQYSHWKKFGLLWPIMHQKCIHLIRVKYKYLTRRKTVNWIEVTFVPFTTINQTLLNISINISRCVKLTRTPTESVGWVQT